MLRASLVQKPKSKSKNAIMITRRDVLKTTLLATAACIATNGVTALRAQTAAAPTGPFKVPPLPYAYDALEPHIDARTMEIHHDKHHAAYVTNLNKAIADSPDLGQRKIEDILKDLGTVPEKIRTAVRNQGGGHYNHTLFWQMMKKGGGGQPTAELAKAIDQSFGSFLAFKDKFTEAATKVFGSGWAWIAAGNDKKLTIESTPNQDTPLSSGRTPLLGIDVWEHAYYLKYQNRRPEYIGAWFNVINWEFVADRFDKLKV
jgi:Fe-Mn family superoxide dismutase